MAKVRGWSWWAIGFGVLALGASPSCSSDETTSEDLSGVEGFCADVAQIYRDAAVACGCYASAEDLDGWQGLARTACAENFVEPVTSNHRGYDESAGQACLATVKAQLADCEVGLDNDLKFVCPDVLVPMVPEGGSCDSHADCVDALDCVNKVCGADPIAVGEPCGDLLQCVSGAYCGAERICQPRLGLGESCAVDTYACEEGLNCRSDTRTCQAPPALGEACAVDWPKCPEPLICDNATTTCQQLGGEGDSCGQPDGCEEGLYCDDAADTCQPQVGEGAPCSQAHACQDELRCTESSQCEYPRSTGEICDDDEQCRSSNCKQGVCQSVICFDGM